MPWTIARCCAAGCRRGRKAGPLLDEIRREEVREADNVKVVGLLEYAFKDAVRRLPQRESSGLIEMQKWFAKLR